MGVGGIGRVWAKFLYEDKRVEVVAMVDVDQAAMDKVCRARGYHASICHRSLEAALAATRADALVCVTPPNVRKNAVIAALHAGLDVISEKPMAGKLSDCHAIVETARATGRACVVSQNYRHFPASVRMADLVRDGAIGTVGQIRIDFSLGCDFGAGYRLEMDYPQIVDMANHHFDLLRFITGLEAETVSGVS